MREPTDLRGQDADAEAAAIAAAAQNERDKADWLQLFGTPWGRRLAWRLMARAGVFQSAFHPDPLMLARNEGRREYGLQMLETVMQVKPEAFVKMQQESST